jgi:hypothetical protein
MNNHKMTFGLLAFYVVAIFLAGCFPEDSLEWSDDGSVGVLRYEKMLALIDGESGRLTRICEMEEEDENPFCNISVSRDGKLIAYSIGVKCSSLAEGLEQLPENQVKLIALGAQHVREQILQGQKDYAKMDLGPFQGEPSVNWVVRYLCENTDQALIEQMGYEEIDKGQLLDILVYKLFVTTPEQIAEGKAELVTTSLGVICWPKVSPDRKSLAFMSWNGFFEGADEGEFLRFDLYVASLKGDVRSMHIADFVAPRYCWRRDSRAITFLENELKEGLQEYSVGTLRTVEIADANGSLLSESEQGSIGTHISQGKQTDLAGVMFHPFMKVQYGASGRIFFSSHAMRLPASTMDNEPMWSVFCYDNVTGGVSDVLPRNVSGDLGGNNAMGYFAISPDEKKMLLPMMKHRFMIYELRKSSASSPIAESEEFGDSEWDIMPAWKGNDEMSCLVSENSHFLTKEGQEKHNRKEIVILGADGKLRRVLSENWPDDICEF